MENLPKKGPLFRVFGAQKPTHMGGTYPYPRHVMYPPGLWPTLPSVDTVLVKCAARLDNVRGEALELVELYGVSGRVA